MKKSYLISLFLILTLLLTVASSTQVTKIGSGSQPTIDGTKVAWTNNGVIHIYDLTTKKDTTINSSKASYPSISGNHLVWHNESTNVPELTVYDIKTGTRFSIKQNVNTYSKPAVYGKKIVWGTNSGADINGNIYMSDISTLKETKIGIGSDPSIYENKIVYSYSGNDTPQIYMYDIATGKMINVSGDGYNLYPNMYKNKVIWSDFNTRMGNIRMYDIATKQQTDITTGNDTDGYDTGGSTNIYDDKIVYVKHHSEEPQNPYIGVGDIYVYCISTGKIIQLFASDTAETPSVSNNIIVWSDSGNVYMTEYSCKPLNQ